MRENKKSFRIYKWENEIEVVNKNYELLFTKGNITIKKEKYKIEIEPVGTLKNIKINENQDEIIYENYLEKIDLIYHIEDDGIKEEIKIKEKQEKLEYEFKINLENLEIEKEKNEIRYVDKKTKQEIFKMDRMFMYDMEYKKSKEIKMDYENNILKIIPDKKWLEATFRKYP